MWINTQSGILVNGDDVSYIYDDKCTKGCLDLYTIMAMLRNGEEIELGCYDLRGKRVKASAELWQALEKDECFRMPMESETLIIEHGSSIAQKLILTWIVNYPSLTGVVMEYIKPEDFTNELYREVATMVYDQARAGKVNVSLILNHFTDSEQHTLVASLFNETIVLDGEGQMANAFADAVLRIKRSSMDQKKEGGQENIMAFYQQMKDLQGLQSKRGELSKRFSECIRGQDAE